MEIGVQQPFPHAAVTIQMGSILQGGEKNEINPELRAHRSVVDWYVRSFHGKAQGREFQATDLRDRLEILLVELLSENPFASALEVKEEEPGRNDQYYSGRKHLKITTLVLTHFRLFLRQIASNP